MNIINDVLVDKCFPDNPNARTVVLAYKDNTASGNPITLTDSAENKPLNMKLYGWSKQDGEPSPDNPVDIVSAGMVYKQIESKNKMNFDRYFGTYKQSDGTYKIPSDKIANKNMYIPDEFSQQEYTLSFTVTVPNGILGIWIGTEDYEDEYTEVNATSGSVTKKVVIRGTMYNETVFYYFVANGVTNDIIISEPQLEYGLEATSYQPYGEVTTKLVGDKVGLSVTGKNLFHITKESDCDKTFYNTTKRIILSGEYVSGLSSNNYKLNLSAFVDFNTNDVSFVYSNNSGYGIGIGTNCKKNKTYTLSFKTNRGLAYAVFYGEDGTYKASVLVPTGNTFAVPEYAEYVVIVLRNSEEAVVGNTIWFKDVQIEETKIITAYEPYRTPQSTSLITPNGLPGIPVPSNTAGITYTDANGQAWISDEIDLERGKYVQRVWKGEFDGSNDESWQISTGEDSVYIDCLSERLSNRVKISNTGHTIRFSYTYISVFNTGYYDDSLPDYGIANWQAHLAANPLVVMTYLDTPIERDLTTAELAEYTQLYSYKPTTVVENDSGCWMGVAYKAGTSGKSKNEALRWYFKNVMPLVE